MNGRLTIPFGIRWPNPIWTRIEQRLNADQIVIQNNDAGTALRLLRERLGANGIVWISVGPEARRTLHIPFIRGTISLATAPPHSIWRAPPIQRCCPSSPFAPVMALMM
jgi:hypothetical protein